MVVNEMRTLLQDMIQDISFDDLPPSWNTFDIESFSKSKKLWDYQQEAVKNAIKVLWKYFEDFENYQENEDLEINDRRKNKFFKWYKDNGLEEDLDIKLGKNNKDKAFLLANYYPQTNDSFSYEFFINRMSFWMATGSGKSLVIIKLIEIMIQLMERREIPPHDILILTYRDDLIEQFKNLVDEFNEFNNSKIVLKELKEYAEVKRQHTLFGTTVFYYRSDNLSDEQKEKIIDFKNFDNEGRWYIFLDEAHKGDNEESKRQHIYSILSRNGFLFNSSATFVDQRDMVTCAYEFNLSSFINRGYGKHIRILKQEIRAFEKGQDYTDDEKQKIVLKSLILLTYVKKIYEEVNNLQPNMYHKPLLLTLVNSVNTEDADLKLFFRELERIARGEISQNIFEEAIKELLEELIKDPSYIFEENQKIKIDQTVLKNITKDDVLKHVYHSETHGEIEILIRPSDKNELAFKLKTSDKPFALIKIGAISGWLKEELVGYEIQEKFEDESFFANLNSDESDINILMGSRSFYEGWDSNRPNVINYINIGKRIDAKKFILQSIGRGIRIEPVKNKRKRLLQLYNSKEIDQNVFDKIKDKVLPLETLFIFGTNRDALETVISELEIERKPENENQLSLFENVKVKKERLFVPVYEQADAPVLKSKVKIKFDISPDDYNLLNDFVKFMDDDRLLLMRYETEPEKIKFLKDSVTDLNNRVRFNIDKSIKSCKNADIILQRYFNYLSVIPSELEGFKPLEEEIKHFKNIKVYLKDIEEIKKKVEVFQSYKDPLEAEKELKEKFTLGEITLDQFTESIKNTDRYFKEEIVEYQGTPLKFKYIPNHYYLPLILSHDEKINYIKHVIKTPSEVKFIEELEKYLELSDNKFRLFDRWAFSKIDESLDEIYIPYYNPNSNKISRFYPDFIFWLQKDKDYYIVFVDPKGTEHTSALRKIDGYEEIFTQAGQETVFNHNGLNIKIKLFLKTDDVSKSTVKYKSYWFEDIDKMIESIIN